MEYKDLKVLIVVKGGVIQSIYSSDQKIQFDILDFDDEELKSNEKEEKLLEFRADRMLAVY